MRRLENPLESGLELKEVTQKQSYYDAAKGTADTVGHCCFALILSTAAGHSPQSL